MLPLATAPRRRASAPGWKATFGTQNGTLGEQARSSEIAGRGRRPVLELGSDYAAPTPKTTCAIPGRMRMRHGKGSAQQQTIFIGILHYGNKAYLILSEGRI